jgi:hypothetical protein
MALAMDRWKTVTPVSNGYTNIALLGGHSEAA